MIENNAIHRDRYRLSLSVFVLFFRADMVLLLKRWKTGWMDGLWSVPAGALNPAETILEAAVREAREEVGIELNSQQLKFVHLEHNLTQSQNWIGAFFQAIDWSGEPVLSEPHKHSHLFWCLKDQLPENMIPYVKQALECIQLGKSYSQYGW